MTRAADLGAALARAEAAARAARWPVASNEHLLVALLELPTVTSRLSLANMDAAAFRDDVTAGVAKLSPPIGPYVGADFFVRTLEAQSPRVVTTFAVCGRLLRSPIPRDLVAASGHTYVDLLYVLSHGVPPGSERMASPYRDVLPDGDYRVVLHDDAFTPTRGVVEILVEVFGLARPQAQAIADAAIADGRATVMELPLAEALQRIETTTQAALGANCPLRFAVEPVDADRRLLP